MKNLGIKIFSIIIFFLLFWCMTFTAENFICSIANMVKIGHFDLRFTAGQNSHFGQWIMAILVITIMPFYFKFHRFMSKLNKKENINKFVKTLSYLFTNLWFIGFVGIFLCYLAEFILGVFLNIILKLNIWDYSKMNICGIPMNLLGQINVFYMPIWFISSISAFVLFKGLYEYDLQTSKVFIDTTFNIIKALFTKNGFIEKIDKSFFEINADYIDKN
jgi:hypothetical protein